MKALLLILAALTLFGSGLLIWRGESSQELWATFATRDAQPSLTITP